jgi:hypothetical protein
MTNMIDMVEKSFSPLATLGHGAIIASNLQSRKIETNVKTSYDSRMFKGNPTNPKVAVMHPDEWGIHAYSPAHMFLNLIDNEMVNHPNVLIPADESQINRLKQLLKDVEV